MTEGMFKKHRASSIIKEDACGRGKCDFCLKKRDIVARRGIQCCSICHVKKKFVDGRWTTENESCSTS